MTTTILLVQQELSHADASQLTGLHEGEAEHFVVLVPVNDGRSRLLEAIDDIAIADFKDLSDDMAHAPSESQATARARNTLETSTRRLTEAGATSVTGVLVPDKPLEALTAAAKQYSADEIIVLVEPHAIEEFFHRDWASRARKLTGLPTLNLIPHEDPINTGDGEGSSS
jgi:hypothetical protein